MVSCNEDSPDIKTINEETSVHLFNKLRTVKGNDSDVPVLADYRDLPPWLQHNDYLTSGYRRPSCSFKACIMSIFRLHTDTVNIWTHFLGCAAFIAIAINYVTNPSIEIHEKVTLGIFFVGTITCLGCSFAFHTVQCHSQCVAKLFAKLDYCGIAFLTTGSFIPWIHYSFYCHFKARVVYSSVVVTFCLLSVMASFYDKFAEPMWRSTRTAVFLTFGLSAIIPTAHYGILEGWNDHLNRTLLMGFLYVVGALLYALRVPERWFRGKCNVWFHSHQIFHLFVLGGVLVYYYSIPEMTMGRIRKPC